MTRNLAQEPVFPIADIQGDILVGLIKKTEHLLFFKIDDVATFRALLVDLAITSMDDCLDQQALIQSRKAAGHDTLIPTPGLNVALTFEGLHRFGIAGLDAAPLDQVFKDGMDLSQATLNDPPSEEWTILKPTNDLHGVFILTGATCAEIADTISRELAPTEGNGWTLLHEEVGVVRPEPTQGHEHFGFADGVSQPGIRGRIDAATPLTPGLSSDDNQGNPGQDLLWPGEFVFGYPGQDPQLGAPQPKFSNKGPVMQPPLPFMENGAYLVFRRLAQRVPEFHTAVKAAAAGIGGAFDKASTDLLGAQMVGRWKSGAPIILAPTADDRTFAEDMPRTNDFEFGDDRRGLTCPWAAHIRKAYPRNDVRNNVTPTDKEADGAEAFTQTHRMLRRGIAFGRELTEDEAKSGVSSPEHARGLLFMCYVTSLGDQFEFVQHAWVNEPNFSQPGSGIDPIIGQSAAQPKPFLGAAPVSGDPARKPGMAFNDFVEMQGGAYFFAPSISALRTI